MRCGSEVWQCGGGCKVPNINMGMTVSTNKSKGLNYERLHHEKNAQGTNRQQR